MINLNSQHYFYLGYDGHSKSSKLQPDFRFLFASHFCKDFTYKEIKTEIRIGFSNFIKSGSVLPQQKCSVMVLFLWVRVRTFWTTFSYIYIYIYIYISLSSCCAISTDISDPLLPPLPIVHCFWQVIRATSSIGTELLYVCSSWTSCLCLSLQRCPQEYITYRLIPTVSSFMIKCCFSLLIDLLILMACQAI